MMMGPGAQLAKAFFEAEVRPLLAREVPALPYLAGRLGSGSDVLSFDDDISSDHDFGCRLTLLVDQVDAAAIPRVDDLLATELPETFDGWPVSFMTSWDGRSRHKVGVETVHAFAHGRLGVDVAGDIGPEDWLSLTGQSVLEVIGGPIFHDGIQEHSRLAHRLRWYPRPLWLYVLAASWSRLSQELPFLGRTATRGDDVGSRTIAARLARDVVHLAFVLECQWSPYPKWAGLALRDLPTGCTVTDQLAMAMASERWQDREQALCRAIDHLGERQVQLGLPIAHPVLQPFFNRSFQIANPEIPTLLADRIEDAYVRRLPVGIGSFEQWCDNVDLLSHPERRPAVCALYRELLAGAGS